MAWSALGVVWFDLTWSGLGLNWYGLGRPGEGKTWGAWNLVWGRGNLGKPAMILRRPGGLYWGASKVDPQASYRKMQFLNKRHTRKV